jgi:hypothetical protein
MFFPDSCAPFPIRARHSRFVRAIPDSCAPFPIRARHSRFVRAIPNSCAFFPVRARFHFEAVGRLPSVLKLAVECPDRSGSATLRLPQPAGSLAEGRFGRGRLLQHDKQGRAIAIGQLSRLDPAQGAFGGDFRFFRDFSGKVGEA